MPNFKTLLLSPGQSSSFSFIIGTDNYFYIDGYSRRANTYILDPGERIVGIDNGTSIALKITWSNEQTILFPEERIELNDEITSGTIKIYPCVSLCLSTVST